MLLKKAGYDVEGAYLKMFETAGPAPAQKTARELGIPFHLVDCTALFEEKVLSHFAKSYKMGLTPNPCVECNRHVKIRELCRYAREQGFDRVVTGHYGSIGKTEEGRYHVKRAGNEKKDQSYVLWSLSQDQLSRVILPLGSLSKAQVRDIARERGFENAEKSDSQDICFVPDGNYASFIEKSTGRKSPAGDVVNSEGKVVGRHDGLINYTIGQRKGLGIAFGKPTYVIGKNSSDNTLVVGSEQELLKKSLIADDLNWISIPELTEPIICKAKTRYRMQEQPCVVYPEPDGRVYVEFNEPQRAITPGQRVVFYDGDIVIGGGVIVE